MAVLLWAAELRTRRGNQGRQNQKAYIQSHLRLQAAQEAHHSRCTGWTISSFSMLPVCLCQVRVGGIIDLVRGGWDRSSGAEARCRGWGDQGH